MSVIGKTVQHIAAGLFSVLLLAVCMVSSSQPVKAATGGEDKESVTLSPVNTRFQIDAGGVREEELTVINDGVTAYDFIVYSRPYSVNDRTYDPNFTQTPSNADAYQWVQFRQTNWHAEPGQTLKIPYTIRVPATAAPGGHYGVVFVEIQPRAAEGGTSVVRKKRVGSIIYATVKGTYTTGAQALGITISPFQFRAPISATASIANTGNADFEVETIYRITDVFGTVKYENRKQSIVLPSTTRDIVLEWSEAPWFGLFHVSAQATFLDQTSKAQSYVLLVPRWLLLVLAVAVVGGGVYAALRNRRR